MNVYELIKLKEKLKKYNLLENIENIGEWLSKLNNRQISNLLELNVDLNKSSQNLTYILDLDLLNIVSNYNDIINLIMSINNESHKQFLFALAKDLSIIKRTFLKNSFYYEMKLIAEALKCKSSKRVEYLCIVAKNQVAIKHGCQTIVMDYIFNAETDTRARLLYEIVIRRRFLSYSLWDMRAIVNANTDEEAIEIYKNIIHRQDLEQDRIEELENFNFDHKSLDLHNSNEEMIDYIVNKAFSKEDCRGMWTEIPGKLLKKIRKSTK